MSEFPWEVKKDSSKESSNKDGSGSGKPAFAQNTGTGPSIPDILANAFAETPMEEVKLGSPPSPELSDRQSKQPEPPGFGDIADITELVSNGAQAPSATPQQSVNELPPFMQAGNAAEVPVSNEESSSSDTFKIGDIAFKPPVAGNASGETPAAPKKVTKRSPPPLFKPVLPGDEGRGSDVVNSAEQVSGAGHDNIFADGHAFAPQPPVSGNDNPPADPFPDQPAITDKPRQDMFTSSGNSPKSEPNAGKTLSETVLSSADPFKQASSQQNPFSAPGSNFDGPLLDYVDPSPNPFSAPSSISPDIGPASTPPDDNPFSASSGPSEGITPDYPGNSANPFNAHAPSPPNTPPESAPGSEDPFSGLTQQSASPFPEFIPPGMNPFPEQVQSSGKQMYSSGLLGSIGASIDVDKLLRNFDGVGGKVRSLFSDLTRGKSLIERMEELNDSEATAAGQNGSSPLDGTASMNTPFPAPQSPEQDPVFSPSGGINAGPEGPGTGGHAEGSPFAGTMGQPVSGDIRKVTPVSEPLMEIKEEHRIDFSDRAPAENENVTTPGHADGISKTIPVGNPEKGTGSDSLAGALPVNEGDDFRNIAEGMEDLSSGEGSVHAGTSLDNEPARTEQISAEVLGLRTELEGMLSRFEGVEGNVSNLSETVSGFGPLLSSGRENEELLAGTATKVGSLDGKVDILEDKVSGLESSLAGVQSDNKDIRSSLARIEENIGELVSSYTALLVQVHESSQENDSRFSQIESALDVLEPLEARFCAIENVQDEARSTSMELARSVSSLVDEIGTTSSGLNNLKESCEIRQDKLEENLGSVTEYLDSELTKVGARSYKGFGNNVHLSNITKNSTNMKLCMEWLEFLMGLVGRNNLPDILSYYEELSWITEQVRSELLHYAEGIDFYMEKPDWKLTPDDHVKSIWFIESLAGMKVDKNRLSVIDRDIEKVKKGTEIYGI
ncbi:FlaD/FlaE family flagellar protein [Methanolobus halotolerans]|uniref:Archaeal flagella protein FlaD/E domain-containing protein n=1 Tax=Methanolobus halotolerans TaxID=2052935 RepID=A0A4E0PXM1_9EURY|nr:FlaD/FlaE family flagellar protein [Methanolobus halotolerans]TGC08040.1 hypothetical protein CUN85_10400 [Methanolobus halotolerans]